MANAHQSHASIIPALVVFAAALGGCGFRAEMAAAHESGTHASAQTSSAFGVATSDGGSPPDADAEESSGEPQRRDPNFLQEPDLGPNADCGLFDQVCPPGEKCNAYANDGGNTWNARKCFPIDPDPDDIGEPCSVVGSGVSGLDSCVLGAMCWNVDPETNLGECVGFCNGSEANPICTDPTLHCMGREFMICLPSCCPLEQDCHPGEACYPDSNIFMCVPDAGGNEGVIFDACEFVNVCDPGLFCADSDRVPGCEESIGCCAPYCEVGSSTCEALHPDLECIAWFEEGHAPFGEEHVGGCLLPE